MAGGHDEPPDGWYGDHENWDWDAGPAGTTGDMKEQYYLETALLRRLCRSMKAATRPCLSSEEFDERLARGVDSWERLASFENDAMVALARKVGQ